MTDQPLKPGAVSVEEGAAYVGIGKTKFYEEMAAGRIKTFVVGARRLVAVVDLDDYIDERRADTGNRTPAA